MQARFVSLRVTETWQMVQGHNPNTTSPAGATFAPYEADPRAADAPPRDLDPTPAREPFPID